MSPRRPSPHSLLPTGTPEAFGQVLGFIRASRQRALRVGNTELLDLYWRIGENLSRKVAQEAWGQGTVQEPGLGGLQGGLRRNDRRDVPERPR